MIKIHSKSLLALSAFLLFALPARADDDAKIAAVDEAAETTEADEATEVETSGEDSAEEGAADDGKKETIDGDATEGAEEEPEPTQEIEAYERRLRLTLPERWKRVKPRNNLIEIEFAVPRLEEDKETPEEERVRGRLTMSSAGGSIDANMRRWIGQFRLGRDADGKDAMRRDAKRLRGAVAHTLDIAGTFFDSPRGPLGPKIERSDYRMLSAIVEVEGAGRYFIKFYGPQDLVEENAEAFDAMIETLTSADEEEPEKPVDPPAESEAPVDEPAESVES